MEEGKIVFRVSFFGKFKIKTGRPFSSSENYKIVECMVLIMMLNEFE